MVTSIRERLALTSERTMGWTLMGFALFAVASIALQNLVFVALAAWVFGMAMRRKWAWRPTPLNWPLVLLGAVLVAASLAAGHLNGSLFGLRKVGLMAIFFLTAAWAEQPATADRALNAFVAGAAVCAAWSVVAHLLGWDGGRARSFSGDYMAAGGMYMLALTLAAARALFAPGARRWIWIAAAALLAAALAFTYTRSSWIGALVALTLVTAARDWRLALAWIGLVVLAYFAFPNSSLVQRASTISTQSYVSSNSERKLMWDSALRMIRDRPLTGYGVDNLGEHYGRYAHPEAIEQNPPHVHNTELQLAINGGVAAVFLFFWWAAAVLMLGWCAWRCKGGVNPERTGAALGLTAAFAGFLANGLFEFNFGTAQVITIVYFLVGLLPAYAAARPGQPDWTLRKRPRFLFLRPRFRGDVLLASAVPRLVKKAFPGAQVDLLTEPGNEIVARGEPDWDEVIVLPRRGFGAWRRAVAAIRAADYDVAGDLFGNPRTAQLVAASGARRKIGPQVTGWGWAYHVRTRADRPGPRPAWEAYYDVLRALGIKDFAFEPRWAVSEADAAWARRFLAERKVRAGRLLGIFPGATHPAKRWPLDRFLTVAKRAARELGLRSVFVFGPLEKDLQAEYERAAGKYFLSARDLTPGQLAALWKSCRLVLSNDAFPLHVGPAVGTPTLGLFGPGEPEVWFPYSPRRHRYLHAAPECWPCRRDVCRDNICWRELTPEQVLAALGEMLAKKPAVKAKAKVRKR